MSKIELSDLVGQGSNVNVKDIKKAEPITAENMEANKAVFNPDANTSKEVSIDQINNALPKKEKEDTTVNAPIVENAFNAMVNTIEHKKEVFDKEVRPKIEAAREEAEIEAELAEDANIEETENIRSELDLNDTEEDEAATVGQFTTDFEVEKEDKPTPAKKVTKPVVEEKEDMQTEIDDIDSLINDLNDDADDDEISTDSDINDESVEELRERLKSNIGDTIKASNNTDDLSTYTISKKPIASLTLLDNLIIDSKKYKTADWILHKTGISITMKEGFGPELDNLRKSMQNSNDLNSTIRVLRFMYDHIVDANKPKFEVWAKCIAFEDLEDLYAAFYKACFGDTNLIAVSCDNEDTENNKPNTGCGKVSIVNFNFDDMVKYENEEDKEAAREIFSHDTTTYKEFKKTTMIKASDNIAITYTEPTLFNTLVQFAGISSNITDKYGDLLETMAYIDGFFYIDSNNKSLVPITYKVYPNNFNKTIISKLKAYSKVLKSLNSDQYMLLTSKLNSLVSESKVKYVIPEWTCPECGTEIPERPIPSMLAMVFDRRQLAPIMNS